MIIDVTCCESESDVLTCCRGQGMVLVLLEAHQLLSTSFQTFKTFRAELAAASARQFETLNRRDASASASAASSRPGGAVQGVVSEDMDGEAHGGVLVLG